MFDGSISNEARLIEKLRAIEALFAGATTAGEEMAADLARQRIKERLDEFNEWDIANEYRFSLGDMWSRRVFCALLRRYDLKPYRYKGQRYTTVMVRVSQRFVDETLWPEYQQISKTLKAYLDDVTTRVVSEVLHPDSSDAPVVPKQLDLIPGSKPTPRQPPSTAAQSTAPSTTKAASQSTTTTNNPSPPQGGAPAATTTGETSNHRNPSRRHNKKRKKNRRGKRR